MFAIISTLWVPVGKKGVGSSTKVVEFLGVIVTTRTCSMIS